MRIIAGRAKGRRLHSPAGDATRPMQDRVKEALFSSLGPLVQGSRVLDLFAGTGSLGLEALSRDAAEATFVESSRATGKVLSTNIATAGLGGRVRLETVERFLARSTEMFDLVFVDPPYPMELIEVEKALGGLADRLAPGAIVVVHRRLGEAQPTVPESMSLVDERRYGKVKLWRYQKEDA